MVLVNSLFKIGLFAVLLTGCMATNNVAETANKQVLETRIESTKPADIVDVASRVPAPFVELRYMTYQNFVGRPVAGYLANKCYLQLAAAKALSTAQKLAKQHGLGLKVLDCYRPQRAVEQFLRWAADEKDIETRDFYYPNIAKSELVGPYITAQSSHSRAASVDVTLARYSPCGSWFELDMGGEWNLFDPISHADNQTIADKPQANRALLATIMRQAGFEAHQHEWWHFTYSEDAYPTTYFDFPIQ